MRMMELGLGYGGRLAYCQLRRAATSLGERPPRAEWDFDRNAAMVRNMVGCAAPRVPKKRPESLTLSLPVHRRVRASILGLRPTAGKPMAKIDVGWKPRV